MLRYSWYFVDNFHLINLQYIASFGWEVGVLFPILFLFIWLIPPFIHFIQMFYNAYLERFFFSRPPRTWVQILLKKKKKESTNCWKIANRIKVFLSRHLGIVRGNDRFVNWNGYLIKCPPKYFFLYFFIVAENSSGYSIFCCCSSPSYIEYRACNKRKLCNTQVVIIVGKWHKYH